ncbi:hypothetical protein [Vogesella sp. XCS3]|uniref:hypothetical protein n=1 Tax=Vogesella sp. XCS3 TaxID=2877939 RepID=UPI001D09B250|nr:hypothetical protein [Vogesella sp. XCS3]UDM18912.1 hypothetical protein LCH97_17870 [Vogesella sp. XCS3]
MELSDEVEYVVEVWHGVKKPDIYLVNGRLFYTPNFDEFDTTGKIEPGAWFSTDEKFARKYGHPVKFLLAIKNPLRHEGPLSGIPDGYDAVFRTHGKGRSLFDALEIAVFNSKQISLAHPIPSGAVKLEEAINKTKNAELNYI